MLPPYILIILCQSFQRVIGKWNQAEITSKYIMQDAKRWLLGMDVESEGLRGYGLVVADIKIKKNSEIEESLSRKYEIEERF